MLSGSVTCPASAARSGGPDQTVRRSPFAPAATIPDWARAPSSDAEPASGCPQADTPAAHPWVLPRQAFLSRRDAASNAVDAAPERDAPVPTGMAPPRGYPVFCGSEEPDYDDLDYESAARYGAALGYGAGPDDEAPSQGAVAGRLVLKGATVDAVLARYPALAAASFRRLFAHCLVGQTFCVSVDASGRKYKRVAIPTQTLAGFEGLLRRHRSRDYVGRDFLEAYQAAFPAFVSTAWRKGKYPRQIRDPGLPADLLALLLDDLAVPVWEAGGLVDFAERAAVPVPTSGRAFQAARTGRLTRLLRAAKRAERSPWLLQRNLLRLLNRTPGNALARRVRANAAAAIAVALEINDPYRRLRTLAALREIQLTPGVLYVPSKRGRTPRAFGDAVCVLSLPKAVRKALLGGSLELDLVNSQLACAARAWNIAPLLAHLQREGAVWPHFLAAVAGTHTLPPDEAKQALKDAVYAACYGMSRWRLRASLARELSERAAAIFLADPLVRALLIARDREIATVDDAGGAVDWLGVFHPVTAETGTPERKAECRSVLACVMQALELLLLAPVIAEAERVAAHSRPSFTVLAWLHDGLTVAVRNRDGRVERKLCRLVREQAELLGVPTSLEATWLGSESPGDRRCSGGRLRSGETRAGDDEDVEGTDAGWTSASPS